MFEQFPYEELGARFPVSPLVRPLYVAPFVLGSEALIDHATFPFTCELSETEG
jgi:hypothetical protein